MGNLSDDDIDGLANRLAMLTGGDGEADNAGRAVAALARRLGLTGGQLKAMFLDGARGGASSARLAQLSARVRHLEAENDGLRDTLGRAELAARSLQRDRDMLEGEVEQLQSALEDRRSASRNRRGFMLFGAAGAAAAIALAAYGPRLFTSERKVQTLDGAPHYLLAVIRDGTTPLRQQPDTTSAALAMLEIGTKLAVHRTLWHNLQQWVEVDLDGKIGYVLSTEVDLS